MSKCMQSVRLGADYEGWSWEQQKGNPTGRRVCMALCSFKQWSAPLSHIYCCCLHCRHCSGSYRTWDGRGGCNGALLVDCSSRLDRLQRWR